MKSVVLLTVCNYCCFWRMCSGLILKNSDFVDLGNVLIVKQSGNI